MDLDGQAQKRVVARAGTSALLDFHMLSGAIFWADGNTGSISRVDMDGTQRQVNCLNNNDPHAIDFRDIKPFKLLFKITILQE